MYFPKETRTQIEQLRRLLDAYKHAFGDYDVTMRTLKRSRPHLAESAEAQQQLATELLRIHSVYNWVVGVSPDTARSKKLQQTDAAAVTEAAQNSATSIVTVANRRQKSAVNTANGYNRHGRRPLPTPPQPQYYHNNGVGVEIEHSEY